MLFVTVLASVTVFSQKTDKPAKQDTSLVTLNMEQLLEKIGFDNLLKTVFDSKKSKSESENKAEMRKAIAAMYGAGIDFKRKAAFYTISTMPDLSNMENFKAPHISFIIPVANRKVMEENWLKLSSKKDNDERAAGFTTNGSMSYMASNRTLTVLTDKEMIISMMPFDYSILTRMNDRSYLGRIIKRDTILIAEDEKVEIVEKNEPKKLKPTIEIDKLVNGKIIRAYKAKPEVKEKIKKDDIRFTPPKIVEEKVVEVEIAKPDIAKPVKKPNSKKKEVKEEVMAIDDVAVVEEPETGVIEDTKAEIMAEEKAVEVMPEVNWSGGMITQKKDTLTYDEYIKGGKVIITYIPYTDAEREANEKKEKEEEAANKEKHAMDFMANLNNWLPYNIQHPDYKNAFESKDDIVMYGNKAFPTGPSSYFSGMSRALIMLDKSSMASPIPQQENSAFFTALNFEKGKMTADMRAGCCGTYNEFISKLYFPVTSFWPKEFSGKNIGSMRLNINMPEITAYYSKILPEKAVKEMEADGVKLTDFASLFTGEIAAVFNENLPGEKYKKEPKIAVGLKIKDAAAAVAFMNKMASQDIKMAGNYRFDENGGYLLFAVDKKFFTPSKIPVAAPVVPPSNNKGEIILDFGRLIKSVTKPSKLEKPETKTMLEFFGKLSMVNNSTEDGHFSSSMTWEMGDKTKNVLASLMEMLQKMDKKKKE